jgi:GNAT superfamily N-acetyltransferase
LPDLEFHAVTPERWQDLETLFGKHGACSGCWCMWWRLKRSEFAKQAGEKNRRALKGIVDSGEVPGLLAYAEGRPVAWCSIAPRERFGSLERSRTLKRVDDRPVWSIVCFFVARAYRGRGIMPRFLEAAVDYAREQGARIVEAYPIEPDKRLTGSDGFTGVASVFRREGFVEVLRRAEKRPIMRRFLEGQSARLGAHSRR